FEVCADGDPPTPTTGRTGGVCLHSGAPIPLAYIRKEGRARQLRQTMLAIAAREGRRTIYVAPDEEQRSAATMVPTTDFEGMPMPDAALGFRVQQYGLHNFLDLFTKRQVYALEVFARLIPEVHEEIRATAIRSGHRDDNMSLESGGTGARAYADAVAAIL